MDKFIIERHDFEVYQNKLNDIINDTKEYINLRTVKEEDEGWIWNSTHNVTGKELNSLVNDLMSHFLKIEDRFLKNYNGLLEIYKLFDIIDKKYVVSIQATIENLIETNKSLKSSQEDIRKLYDNQHVTLEKLVKFKQELEETKILSNIKLIYEEINNMNLLFDKNKKDMETVSSIIYTNTNELKKIKENQKNLEEEYENKINLLELKNEVLKGRINKEIFKAKILSTFSIILLIISLILIFIKRV